MFFIPKQNGQTLYRELISRCDASLLDQSDLLNKKKIGITVLDSLLPFMNVFFYHLIAAYPDYRFNIKLSANNRIFPQNNDMILGFSAPGSMENYLCTTYTEKLLIIMKKGLSAEEIEQLPFIQNSLFANNTIFNLAHNYLCQRGFSRKVIVLDNRKRRHSVIAAGEGIALSFNTYLDDNERERFYLFNKGMHKNFKLRHSFYLNKQYSSWWSNIIALLKSVSGVKWSRISEPSLIHTGK